MNALPVEVLSIILACLPATDVVRRPKRSGTRAPYLLPGPILVMSARLYALAQDPSFWEWVCTTRRPGLRAGPTFGIDVFGRCFFWPGIDDDKAMRTALETLPGAVLNLDEFKRCYSNNDTRTIAAPFLFEKYDPAGYTCMWSSYKYNSELPKMVLVTSGIISGTFARMEALHKFVFGSVVIIGTEAAQEVHGFWILRGKGMPGLMACVDWVDHFDWFDIPDLKAEADRITDFLDCDGKSFEKKPVLEYKIFK